MTSRGILRRLPALLLLAVVALLSACADGSPGPQAAAEPATATPAAVGAGPVAGPSPTPATGPAATPPGREPGATPSRADPTPSPAPPTPTRSPVKPPEELKDITVSVSGRVDTVEPDDGVITFDESVHGFTRVTIVEDTEIVSADGVPVGMEDIGPGTVIQATGAPDGDGGVIARSVRVEPS
jgi:hypothetical protein